MHSSHDVAEIWFYNMLKLKSKQFTHFYVFCKNSSAKLMMNQKETWSHKCASHMTLKEEKKEDYSDDIEFSFINLILFILKLKIENVFYYHLFTPEILCEKELLNCNWFYR